MNRNPYKPLDIIDPTEHEQYPTQARHFHHDLGQARRQEPPLAPPSQAPATNLPALAKLPNFKKTKPSGPSRARRHDDDKDKLGGKAKKKTQSMSEGRERMKAEKRQIAQEQQQNAATSMAEIPLEQDAEDNETMAAEMEA